MPDKQTLVPTVGDVMAALRLVDIGGGEFALAISGAGASGVADAGGSLKVGGVYRASPAVLTDGQRSDLITDQRQHLQVALYQPDGGLSAGYTQASADGISNTLNAYRNLGFGHVFNGTTWDRQKGDTTGLYVVGAVANGGDVSAVRPVIMGAIDANSVTGRRLRAGIYGDQYIEGGSATARLASSAASVNSTLVKASAGKLFTINGYNANAAVRHLKIYNKATAPTVGTDTPIFTIPLEPLKPFFYALPGGFQFATGIGFGLTTGVADSDTGAVAAGDIIGLQLGYT